VQVLGGSGASNGVPLRSIGRWLSGWLVMTSACDAAMAAKNGAVRPSGARQRWCGDSVRQGSTDDAAVMNSNCIYTRNIYIYV
jgi:hypothetical protein